MEVLLKEAVVKLGMRGQIVKVAPGYARNYLFPKRMAVPVTEGNKRQLEIERRNYDKKQGETKSIAEDVKAKLEEIVLDIPKRAADNGHLFGSVTAHEVAKLVSEQGIEIERRRLELPTIKELGEYTATVRLHPEVSAQFKINVIPQA